MRTILLNDDPGMIRALQGSFLNRAECRVVTGAPGETAERARHERPDLILLAAASRAAQVREACRRLKSDGALQEIPVVVFAPEPQHLQWSEAGADAVLAYPPAREHLSETVRTLLPGLLRAAERRRATLGVAFFHGDDERFGYSKDLAVGGLFLRTRERLDVGDRLQLIFELPSGDRPTIRADGEIVRCVQHAPDSHLMAGVGVRFRRLGSRDGRQLARFVGEAP